MNVLSMHFDIGRGPASWGDNITGIRAAASPSFPLPSTSSVPRTMDCP